MAVNKTTLSDIAPSPRSSQTYIVMTALVPLLSAGLEKEFGWHLALSTLGFLIVLIAFPMAYFIKEPPVKLERKEHGEPMVPAGRSFVQRCSKKLCHWIYSIDMPGSSRCNHRLIFA